MSPSEGDDLLPHSSSSNSSRLEHAQQLQWHRLSLIVLLSLLVATAIVFQVEITGLSTQLAKEHTRVDNLNTILGIHEEVIERFNTSVTNSDVMTRLETLETDVSDTKHKLLKDLEQVQMGVSQQLNATLAELSATVSEAKDEIHDEVEKVKKDVEAYVIKTQDQFSMENSFMVYQLAGTFTVLSCLISVFHMTNHLRKMNQPDVQRKILAILWMVPIYAVTSWFSLVFHSAEGYLAILKDGYEAYVIYQFLSFCIAVLGKGDRNVVVDMLAQHADHLTPPFRLLGIFELCGCCVPPPYENNRALADDILLQCQFFAMQFVFLRPLTTTAMVVLGKLQYYGGGDGPEDYRAPQFYITIVQNISIFTAFTGLLKFYHAVDKDLAWCRPFAKFLCIKCVVFMTFWQGLAISVLARTTDVGGQDAEEWAQSAQNFLICLEMLLFSIAHFYCFPTDEWEEGYRVKHSKGNFGDSIALGDFFSDLKLILSANQNGKRKKKKHSSESAIPEGSKEESEGMDTMSDNNLNGSERESPQARIAHALEESLGLAGDDPDIAEAKQRLLESNVLSPEMFDMDDENDASDDLLNRFLGERHDDDNENGSLGDEEQGAPRELSDVESAEDQSPPYDPYRGIYSDKAYHEGDALETPNEQTRLIGSTGPPTPLRPSIFTTVSELLDSDDGEPKKDTTTNATDVV